MARRGDGLGGLTSEYESTACSQCGRKFAVIRRENTASDAHVCTNLVCPRRTDLTKVPSWKIV